VSHPVDTFPWNHWRPTMQHWEDVIFHSNAIVSPQTVERICQMWFEAPYV
jgi:hypothetical protein